MSDSADLLDQLLGSLLEDFEQAFRRGLVLLEHTPASLLPASEQRQLEQQLRAGLAELVATRALRAASPSPMAVDMGAMTPWHRLMMRVWTLSFHLRQAGIVPNQGA
ncbi:MAG: DUF2605 family protein [Cyanobacteriota bacterium]|nr:DUF2605 family protein [Cyanobacteriota bacterium]